MGLGVLGSATAHAATLTFAPVADARVEQLSPKKNYGKAYLATRGSLWKTQTVLRFTVQGLSGSVTAAKLRLRATASTADGPAVFGTTTTWSESTVNWNNRPAALGAASADVGAIKSNTWVEWNVTPLVAGNGSVALVLVQPSGAEATYVSREGTASLRPQLVVTFAADPCLGAANGTPCDDANNCTTDACQNGTCLGTALNCDDANVCTVDACLAGVCTHSPGTGSCDADANACTIDTCQSGTCAAAPPKNCDDGNPCTIDTCAPATGVCTSVANGDPTCGVPPPGGCLATEADETLCNGIDDDCDGLTDWLLPVPANACANGLPGACGKGFAACLGGAWSCLAPPAIAETWNGIDDDCDGVIDDVAPTPVLPLRVRVAVPPYMWSDSPGLVDAVLEQMQHIGLEAKGPTPAEGATDWDVALGQLNQYALVYFPGYVLSGSLSATQLAQLTAWVEAGGVLVLGKPSGTALQNLAGLASVTNHSDATSIRVTPTAPATLWLDSLEERDILLSTDPSEVPVFIQTYTLLADGGAVAFGQARANDTPVGAVFVRRAVGQGAVYSLGYDPLSWGSVRCYVNCFDPGKDVLAMLLKAMAREAMRGHYLVKHTAPGLQAGVQLLSHDTCAPDAWTAGAWGQPGGTRMAQMEQALGVHASFMVQSDYVNGWFSPAVLLQWLDLGARVDGLHTVQHFDMSLFGLGNCAVTQASYNAANPTLCGEIVVNKQVTDALLAPGAKTTAFRAPYLAVNNQQFDVLAAQGIAFDGSFALGDVRTSYPISAAREPSLAWKVNHQPLFTFPLTQEDGMGAMEGGVASRVELQPANTAQFLARWKYALLQNLRNSAWSTILVHPSYGEAVPVSNLQTKIDVMQAFLVFAQAQDVVLGDFSTLGAFWRGRDGVRVEATWNEVQGYSGTISVGAVPAPQVTLEFGDAIATFACPDCGPAQVGGHRVTLTGTLAAGSVVAFQAAP